MVPVELLALVHYINTYVILAQSQDENENALMWESWKMKCNYICDGFVQWNIKVYFDGTSFGVSETAFFVSTAHDWSWER